MIEYYFIMCLSFALMYTFKYGIEIVQNVLTLVDIFDINYKPIWSPSVYLGVFFVSSLIAMPLFALSMFAQSKCETIKYGTARVMEKRFGLKKSN